MRHFDGGRFQFRREAGTQRGEKRNRFGMGHGPGASGIEIRAPARDTALIGFGRGGGFVGAVHLGGKAAEFRQCQIGGAAFGIGRRVRRGGGETGGAFGRKIGGQDVGGGMQVVLRVTADQLVIGGEGHVAFQDAGTHAGGGDIGFYGMFGKHHRRAPVADGEQRRFGLLAQAGGQPGLEIAIGKPGDQEGRAGTIAVAIGGQVVFGLGCERDEGKGREGCETAHGSSVNSGCRRVPSDGSL